jgi:hypothetical protein
MQFEGSACGLPRLLDLAPFSVTAEAGLFVYAPFYLSKHLCQELFLCLQDMLAIYLQVVIAYSGHEG